MKKNLLLFPALLLSATILFSSCMADLRSKIIKEDGITEANTIKGKNLLAKAYKNQGFENFEKHKVYSFVGVDQWKGLLGKVGKIWPDNKSKLQFKYEVGTFDGQIAFLDGKRKGDIAGMQNWHYYEKTAQTAATFKDPNKKIRFGLAAYQYFGEMIGRLQNAPIISYAGERELRGETYDLVFCTWHEANPHQEADQYIAWIHKESGLMEFAQYTIRENYLKAPGNKMVYGGVEFSDFKNIEGAMIPHKHTIYVFDLKKKKKKYLHEMSISDFQFDRFPLKELRPDTSLEKGGDFKASK